MKRAIVLIGWLTLCLGVLWWWLDSHLREGYGIFLPPHGTVLGEVEGVVVSSANGPSRRGVYGLEYECVELVNRAYVQKFGHANMTRSGHADSYYWTSWKKGLLSYPNGGTDPPQKWDTLVFDEGPDDGSVGHVALVTKIDLQKKEVVFIQQNVVVHRNPFFRKYIWQDSLLLRKDNSGRWWVDVRPPYRIPVAGWSRPNRR